MALNFKTPVLQRECDTNPFIFINRAENDKGVVFTTNGPADIATHNDYDEGIVSKTYGPAQQDPVITQEVEKAENSTTKVDRRYYLPLYKAALEGDWKKAEKFIDEDPGAASAVINLEGRTALHVAAYGDSTEFIVKLVERMPVEALALKDMYGTTALHLIAICGTVRAAKALVKKNPALPMVEDKVYKHTPLTSLVSSSSLSSKEMLWYLCSVTKDEDPTYAFSGENGALLIFGLTYTGHYDICMHLMERYPHLATITTKDGLNTIAGLCLCSSAFPSGTELGFWKTCIYKILPMENHHTHSPGMDIEVPDESARREVQMHSSIETRYGLSRVHQWITRSMLWKAVFDRLIAIPSVKKLHDMKLSHKCSMEMLEYVCEKALQLNEEDLTKFLTQDVMLKATHSGIVEIVAACVKHFQDLVDTKTTEDALIHVAIKKRREKIFNFILENCSVLALRTDGPESGENILHMVAELAPSSQLNSVSGAPLQMQRELQWFKEVEKLVSNNDKMLQNKINKETPYEIFTKEHQKLMRKAEEWMKDTSNSCMVVATLITTIAFAAAFAVPGGNADKGTPIFLNNKSFLIFALSDALALFSSVTSVIMFLAILTSRYAEEDFLRSLPSKLIIGLSSLLLALANMLIAFGAGLSLVLGEKLEWIFVPVIVLACIPLGLFGMLQLPLLIQMVLCTYGRSIFYQPSDRE